MSIVGLVSVLLALVAVLLLALYLLQRRELRAVAAMSREVQRVAIGGRLSDRVDLQTDQPELAALGTAINHLLARVGAQSDRERLSPVLFADLGDRIHEVVIVHRDVILYANRQFANLVGVERAVLPGRRLADIVAADSAELVEENLRRKLAGEATADRYEIDIIGLQGSASRLEIATTVIDYDGGPAVLVTGVEVVPTQTVPALRAPPRADAAEPGEPAPGRTPARDDALESLAEGIVVTDARGQIEYMNAAAEALTGTTRIEAQGRRFEDIVSLVDETERRAITDPVRHAIESGAAVRAPRRALLVARDSGEERAIAPLTSPLRDAGGNVTGTVVLLHDVTELRGMARQMSYQATHDALTGLVNRREFERRLEEAAEAARRGDGTHILCYLDLDRFKLVNDTSGHVAGDSLLREVAKILRDAVRDSDTVARIGGDEFGMLLLGCPLDKARQSADDVCRAVADHRFVWRDRVFSIGVSVGIVELSRESGTIDELLAAADSACYMAKRQGSGQVAVYSARDEAAERRTGELQWLHRLQAALRENRFQLYHQPIVPALGANGTGPALEVLVRLRDATGTDVVPAAFMHAAERYRLTAFIDRWVVQTTLAALGRGAIQTPPGRSVAINISGQTLSDAQFLEFVVDCFDRTGVAPSRVCFEISEAAVSANLAEARRFISVLHGMGCQFALDDFGAGAGSFVNLKTLPLDFVKIAGSFMKNLGSDSVNRAMVDAMVKLARTLEFRVIAAAVEDAAALEAARTMGFDYIQGFAIARPAPLPMAA